MASPAAQPQDLGPFVTPSPIGGTREEQVSGVYPGDAQVMDEDRTLVHPAPGRRGVGTFDGGGR